jgi:hypothetical protein
VSREQVGSSCVYDFEFQGPLLSGESGSVISGTIHLDHQFDSRRTNEKFDCPLFMLVARRKSNRCHGLAIYLPDILRNLRLAEFGNVLIFPEIDMNDWELITTVGEINSLARTLNRATVWAELLRSESSVDRCFVQHVQDNLLDSSGNFVRRYEKLYNGLCLASKDNCRDAAVTDKCWVIDYERENHTGTNGYYACVASEMAAASITNLSPEATGVKTFSGSSIPITVDKVSFENEYNKPPINYKCHHPFLCERNDNCRGLVMQQNGRSPVLTHCCIRPSHLVCLHKCFNDMNVVLQGKFDEPSKTFAYERLSSTMSW